MAGTNVKQLIPPEYAVKSYIDWKFSSHFPRTHVKGQGGMKRPLDFIESNVYNVCMVRCIA